MPGKVNPTQAEALTMVCAQVMGNDAAVGFAGSQGHFELNVFKPVIAYNVLQSMQLLGDAAASFTDNCVVGIEADEERIAQADAREPDAGHGAGARRSATTTPPRSPRPRTRTARRCARRPIALGFVDAETFDRVVRPEDMLGPK